MNDTDIRYYGSILLRRLPFIMAVTITAFLLAIGVTRLIPPTYTAGAKILAEAPQIPTELARSTVPIGAVEQLQILLQQITTRDALLALAAKMDIYGHQETEPDDESIVRDLRSRIRFDQVALESRDPGSATVFEVTFTDTKAEQAAKVANELAAMILARNQRQRKDRAGSTLQFFDQEVANLDIQLKQLEAEMLKFKIENKDTLPESVDFRRNLQSSLQERLTSLEREDSDLRSRRNMLIITYTSTGQLSGAVPLTPEQQMLADLNKALAEQLSVFSEDSPNIKAIRARIASLQKTVLARPSSARPEGAAETKNAPFGLELQLSDIDNRLKANTAEKTKIAEKIDEITKSISETPQSETLLEALKRSRDNIQTQYNAAIARRAEALTGAQIEMRSDGSRFTLLEDATPPERPTSPKRRMLIGMGTAAGFGLAFALVVLWEMLHRTVRRPKDLAQLLQSQPLATIPVIKTRSQNRTTLRHRTAMLLSIGAVPASLAIMHHYVSLNHIVQKLATGLGLIGAA